MDEPKIKAGSVPDAWKEGYCRYSDGLNLALAKIMLDASEQEAIKQGLLMAISIVDCGGNLLAFYRMDNAALFGIQVSLDKAYTSVFGKLPTTRWYNTFNSGGLPSLFFHERWTAIPGGVPLIRDGALLGGIGVSGATAYGDLSVARAGIKAGNFETDLIDSVLASMNSSQ